MRRRPNESGRLELQGEDLGQLSPSQLAEHRAVIQVLGVGKS